MLYVVGDSLPKTDFLTCIDQVIVLTMATLAMIGISSTAIFLVSNSHNMEVATRWNNYVAVVASSIYVLANAWLLLLPWCRKNSALKILAKDSVNTEEAAALERATTVGHIGISQSGVPAGDFKYWTMETLRRR